MVNPLLSNCLYFLHLLTFSRDAANFCLLIFWNTFYQLPNRGAIKIDFRKNLGFWPNQRIRKWCLTLHTFRRKIYRLSFWDESIVNSDHNCAQNSSKLVSNTIQILVFDATYSSIIWNWNIHVQQIVHTIRQLYFKAQLLQVDIYKLNVHTTHCLWRGPTVSTSWHISYIQMKWVHSPWRGSHHPWIQHLLTIRIFGQLINLVCKLNSSLHVETLEKNIMKTKVALWTNDLIFRSMDIPHQRMHCEGPSASSSLVKGKVLGSCVSGSSIDIFPALHSTLLCYLHPFWWFSPISSLPWPVERRCISSLLI